MNWINKIFGGNKPESSVPSTEEIYLNLKKDNPDKDEHWWLAHTWLSKYADWEAVKQKGPKLTKYIAYTTTFNWSFLNYPDSIKGLALFLAYKERGDKESENEEETMESSRIIESIQNIMKNPNLLETYESKNPFTWNEIQIEKDDSRYGLYGFLQAVEHLNKNPEEEERVIKILENI